MTLGPRRGVVQFCQVAKVPKCVSTAEENCDKAGVGFLHVCSVDMSGWSDGEIQMREEVGAAVRQTGPRLRY